jgi:hypothetical protein
MERERENGREMMDRYHIPAIQHLDENERNG